LTHNDIKSLSGINNFLLDAQLLNDLAQNTMFPAYENIARTRRFPSEIEVRRPGEGETYPG
jgi:hypothetical protein